MPKVVTKCDRLKSMLIDEDNFFKEFDRQLQDVVEDFDQWIQKNLPDLSLQNSKKGRKRNIEAILEKNEDCKSSFDSNSSEPEDGRREISDRENNTRNEETSSVINENENGKRSKRAASKFAEQMISKQVNVSLGQKLRRPEDFNQFGVQIKTEKLSILPSNNEFAVPEVPSNRVGKTKKRSKNNESNSNKDVSNVVVKQEKDGKDKKVRASRMKNKTQREQSKQGTSNQTDDEDDVQIEIPKGIVLTVSDSEDEIENNDKIVSKTKKNSIVDKSVNELSEKTELKNANETGNEHSVYEDARDQISAATTVASPAIQECFVQLNNLSNFNANETYNIKNDSNVEENQPKNRNDGINKEPQLTLNNTIVLHKGTNNQYMESPLKSLNDNTFNMNDQDAVIRNKKVKEQNKTEISQPVQRITRTKKKAIDAAAAAAVVEAKENYYKKDGVESKNNKHQTQNVNQNYESALKTKSNNKLNNIVSNIESFIPKPASAVKLLKSDLREKREEDTRKKLEKEEEVQKKKEAMIQAKVEEQKKKRMEKAMRAQQTREQIEKERQMQVEKQEREKQEKLKQMQAEREAAKKEAARKRALADKRAHENEERRRAEDVARQQRLQQEQEEIEKRLEAQRKRDQEELEKKRLQEEYEQAKAKARAQKLAAATKSKEQLPKAKKVAEATPVVKTETVFDLDTDAESEDEDHPKRPVPIWSKNPYRTQALEKQSQIPDRIICSLFGSKPTSIDLRAVFPNISENRLRRQSSAVWNTPPRYSLMPKEY